MPLISTRALTKRYPGGVTALDGLTVEIEPGIIGLVGANGAGKSTLLKILLGLLPATDGEARVFDLDCATQGARIRELVGYMAGRDEMLGLIERIGREFGIAVIVASHLLGEIERVGDWLVAIDAGRILRTASISSFTERTGQLLIEADEDASGLAARLVSRGIDACAEGR